MSVIADTGSGAAAPEPKETQESQAAVGNVPVASTKPGSGRRKLYKLHAWVGFHLAFFMSVILFTGTFAVLSNEIDWLIQDDMRVSPGTEKVSWGEMARAVRDYAPDDVLSMLSDGEGDHFAYRATMFSENGKRYFIHVNQWTGDVTGTTHALTVQRFFRDLHRYLFMPGVIALPLVCSLAFILAISLYTGIKTTRNWRQVAFRVRTHKGLRIAVGDYHKAAGLWGIWFFVIIIATTLWYLAEWGAAIGGQRFEPSRPGVTQERAADFGALIEDADADALVAAARDAFPGFTPTEIQFAQVPRQSVTVLGRADDPLVRDRANRVFLDPVSTAVVKVQKSEEIGWVAYLNEIADPLHFGFFGNLPTKIIWFVFGLSMTSLSLTGLWLTYKRLKSVHISRGQYATFPILLAGVVVGFFYVDNYISYDDVGPERQVWAAETGPLTSELRVSTDVSDEKGQAVRLIVSAPAGRPNVKAAQLTRGGETVDLKRRRLGRQVIFRGALEGASVDGDIQATITLENDEVLRLGPE